MTGSAVNSAKLRNEVSVLMLLPDFGGSPSSLDSLYDVRFVFRRGESEGGVTARWTRHPGSGGGRADDGKRSELSEAEERSLSFVAAARLRRASQ